MIDSKGCCWCGLRGLEGEVAKDGAVSSSVDLGEGLVHATLDDLVLVLNVTIDDLLRVHPEQLPPRPKVGFVPKITDAELITLAVMAALATPANVAGSETHAGHTPAGVCTRIAQRILALTATIWHNDHLGATIRRSLIAYGH